MCLLLLLRIDGGVNMRTVFTGICSHPITFRGLGTSPHLSRLTGEPLVLSRVDGSCPTRLTPLFGCCGVCSAYRSASSCLRGKEGVGEIFFFVLVGWLSGMSPADRRTEQPPRNAAARIYIHSRLSILSSCVFWGRGGGGGNESLGRGTGGMFRV